MSWNVRLLSLAWGDAHLQSERCLTHSAHVKSYWKGLLNVRECHVHVVHWLQAITHPLLSSGRHWLCAPLHAVLMLCFTWQLLNQEWTERFEPVFPKGVAIANADTFNAVRFCFVNDEGGAAHSNKERSQKGRNATRICWLQLEVNVHFKQVHTYSHSLGAVTPIHLV